MNEKMDSKQSKNVTIEIRDAVAVIWLDKSNSEQNIMSFNLLSDFEKTFVTLENDDSIGLFSRFVVFSVTTASL